MNDDLWRKLVINAPEFIAIVDRSGIIRFANWFDGHADRDKVIGTSIFQHAIPKHHDVIKQGLTKVFDQHEPAAWEVQSYDLSGSVSWWSTLVVPLDVDQDEPEAVLYGRNINTQKRIEEDLRESEKRLIEAEKIGRVGHWHWNLETDQIRWSDQIFRILGLQPGELQPSVAAFREFIPEDEKAEFDRQVNEARALNFPDDADEVCFSRTICLRNGTLAYLLDRGILIRDANGKVSFLHGILQDITDLKNIEIELQKERDLLQRKNVTLSEVVKNVEGQIGEIKESIGREITGRLEPMLVRLRRRLKPADLAYLSEIESTLKEITEPIIGTIPQSLSKLTPRESEVCTWIKKGYTSREIAEILKVSPQTVDKFRQRIRRKLDLTDHRVNLTNYLRTAIFNGKKDSS